MSNLTQTAKWEVRMKKNNTQGPKKKTGDQTSFLAQIGPRGSFIPSFGFQDQTPFNYMYKC